MRLSIVSTLYNSAPVLEEFYRRARAAAEQVSNEFEIVLVNDGSADNSLACARGLVDRDSRVRVVDLSRNFGHHKAIMTGLEYACGDLTFVIDSDLEEAPELLGPFYNEMLASGADVVYGFQAERKGSWFRQVSGSLFYRLFNALSTYPVPSNLVTARLLTARYRASLLQHRERELFLGGLWAITGFKQVPVAVEKLHKGESSYSLRRRIALLVTAITSFSERPLNFIFYLGCVIMVVSGGSALYLVFRRLFFGDMLGGWPSLIVSIWMLGGITIFCIGILGIYLSKVFIEVKARPYTIVAATYERHAGFNEQLPADTSERRAVLH